MKKGKTLTVLVLVLEIASIAVLHAVKINSEKTAVKEAARNISPETVDSRSRSGFTLAVFK